MFTGKQSIASRALPEKTSKRGRTIKLDAKTIAKLALPEGKLDAIYFDDDLGGFGLRLRASGDRVRRTWIAQYRAHGRTRRMKIGAAEKLNVDDARKAARKILAKVELGQDPQGDKAKARLASGRTLRSVADDYLEAKQSVLRPASYRGTKLYLTGPYFKPLHSTTITDITLADVAARIGPDFDVAERAFKRGASELCLRHELVDCGGELQIERGVVLRKHVLPIGFFAHLDPRDRIVAFIEVGDFVGRVFGRGVKHRDGDHRWQAAGDAGVEEEVEAH